jgi:hypothetical protein
MTPGIKTSQTVNPKILLAEACFNARDYMITKGNIRTSFQFNEIYQDYYIGKLHPDRFDFLGDAKSFNFNYDYQVGSSPADIKKRLGDDGANIPEYLT